MRAFAASVCRSNVARSAFCVRGGPTLVRYGCCKPWAVAAATQRCAAACTAAGSRRCFSGATAPSSVPPAKWTAASPQPRVTSGGGAGQQAPRLSVAVFHTALRACTALCDAPLHEVTASASELVTEEHLRTAADGNPNAMMKLLQAAGTGVPPTPSTFASVMRVLGASGSWQAALALLQAMAEAGVEPDSATYHAGLWALASVGESGRAEALLGEMKARGLAPTPATYAQALRCMTKEADAERAMSLFEAAAAGGVADVSVYNALLRAHGLGGRLDQVFACLQLMIVVGVTADAATAKYVLRACEAKNDWQRALEAVNLIERSGTQLDVQSHNRVVRVVAAACEPSQVVATLESLRRRGVVFDDGTMEILLLSFVRAGKHEEAIRWLPALGTFGVQPATRHVNFVLQQLQKERLGGAALDVFAGMDAGAVRPDSTTFSIIINLLGRMRRWEEAWKVFQGIPFRGVPHDSQTFGDIITVLTRAEQHKLAWRVYKRMVRVGVTPLPAMLRVLMRRLLAEDNIGHALFVYGTAAEAGVSLDAAQRNDLLAMLARAAKWTDVIRVFDDMVEDNVASVHAYNMALSAWRRRGEWRRVVSVLEGMVAAGRRPTAATLLHVLGAVGEAEQWDRGLALLQELAWRDASPSAGVEYNLAVADAIQNAGYWRVAPQVVRAMLDAGIQPDAGTCAALVTSLARNEQAAQALQLLQEFTDGGVTLSTLAYNAVLQGLRDQRDIARAEQLFERMPAARVRRDAATFSIMIRALGDVGQWGAALELFHGMKDTGVLPNQYVCRAATRVLVGAGQYTQAVSLLEFMRRVRRPPDAETYHFTIATLGRAGQWDQALGVYDEMCERVPRSQPGAGQLRRKARDLVHGRG